ncbi:hypothetical protein [endosymbiont GvMRE of Glomus versiforme]|uniref:hypothetical protein n=1 Tax=endosymbiont GvMRE of Glomus versiforme TaxID=2039283 RepID=UPI001559942A|nr:hypothetical protein [endosymbiont GvMRE of Glomus versiforme]
MEYLSKEKIILANLLGNCEITKKDFQEKELGKTIDWTKWVEATFKEIQKPK